MNTSEVRQAITGLRRLSDGAQLTGKYAKHLDDAVAAVDEDRLFAGYLKLANTASYMFDDMTGPEVRRALASLAFHGYDYCVKSSTGRTDVSPSRNKVEAQAQALGGVLPCTKALSLIQAHLVGLVEPGQDQPSSTLEAEALENTDGAIDVVPSVPPPVVSAAYFEEAVSVPLQGRLVQQVSEWKQPNDTRTSGSEPKVFEERLRRLLDTGEAGRQFGGFAILDADLDALRSDLGLFAVPRKPFELLERAQSSRALASVEFRIADAELFRTSRHCWLLSAYWNSALTGMWATNEEQFVYDILGYLNVIQAEHRYAIAHEDVLLLLRVSHLITRIASNDTLLPDNIYERFGRIQSWVRYTVGTVLAVSGPGRVPPSRIKNDPRLLDANGKEQNRDDFGRILIPQWRTAGEREAACAILLELAGWKLSGATRLVQSTLAHDSAACEVWSRLLADVVKRASRVKVVRPNPWSEAAKGKLITAERHALSVLASDVIHRTFPSLESNISLNGTSFRQRRVPTFVCSADFGPLGLFKADARERIAREAENFTRYAQRLHPRYRASRCDKSVAMISEPDDRVEFVSGLLTSYAFTAREAPQTLNSWLQVSEPSAVVALISELFREALRPWYQLATVGVVDILPQYEPFSRLGLLRLRAGLEARRDLTIANGVAILWLEAIMNWVTGQVESVDSVTESHAAQLQMCETMTSVTHGDLHLENILVLGKRGAEYPCLIDFETTTEAHLLRDFGRFAGAVLFRTYEWNATEAIQIRAAVAKGAAGHFANMAPLVGDETPNVSKAMVVVEEAWKSYLCHWRAGTRPGLLEIVAMLVCSFLTMARYPDTKQSAAQLALQLSDDLVLAICSPSAARGFV